jgi:hypothetical protein
VVLSEALPARFCHGGGELVFFVVSHQCSCSFVRTYRIKTQTVLPRRRPRRCWSGLCWLLVRSQCARRTAGEASPRPRRGSRTVESQDNSQFLPLLAAACFSGKFLYDRFQTLGRASPRIRPSDRTSPSIGWGIVSTVKQRTLTPLILVRIQVPQPASPVSGVLFPGWREPPTFPRVRRTRPTRFVAETVARAISAAAVMKISPALFRG